ncbi:hypothetical protein B0T17DRAFT_536147 [Bombardia bombarda]|uniref:Elongin-A n=1 Tax=Bombardia bombarda TaxID=252184 RepID=A0AA39WM19_9PEZI|nr:hypothetical protein B0T17DRAFT_536147 [Bombardia bombarda]
MAPRSLVEMCIRTAIENVHMITSVENMPPKAIQEILRAVKSAKQLHQIEINHSDDSIYDESVEHWKRIIKRDFKILSAKHQWVPSNPKSWHKVWEKYKKLETESNARATEALKAAFATQKEQRESRMATIISVSDTKKLPRLPKEGRTYNAPREAYQGMRSSNGTVKHVVRPKQTFLQKAMREARDDAKRIKLSTPTGKLPVRPGQIVRAPESMLNDRRINNQFDPAATLIKAPRPKPASSGAELSSERERKEKEARLLKIKGLSGSTKTAAPSGNAVSFDDDDDDDDEDDDDNDHRRGNGSSRNELDNLFDDDQPFHYDSYGSTSPPLKPRRGGILSAAHGTTKIVRVSVDSVSPPALGPTDPEPRPRNDSPPGDSAASGGAASPPTQIIIKRKRPANAFMLPNKRPRR